MEQIKVRYLTHCGSDKTVVNAARISFADDAIWDSLPQGYSEESANKLIKYLASHRHTTPFRHNSVTIACTAPCAIARQLAKHQAGLSWNEESRRYITKGVEVFQPKTFRAKPTGSIKQGSSDKSVDTLLINGSEVSVMDAYNGHMRASIELHEAMLKAGIAPEMTRFVLPQSALFTWVWTGNLLAFAHIFNERSASGAQLEAQDFASKLQQVMQPLFPISWNELTNKGTK